ncbi:MAG: flotillin family protein [Myxococcales bacterium FL481]|nr:MAG: flotillin family protein [Myxococcales bacterium FL481]
MSISSPLLIGAIGIPTVVTGGVLFAAALLSFLVVVKQFLHIGRTNEVLIFSGRKRVRNGVDLGPLIVMSRGTADQIVDHPGLGRGRAWRVPIIEVVDRMETTTLSTDIVVQNAYSKGNIPLRIHAIANIKIHSDPRFVRNAVERFLGRSPHEISLVGQQTLEGALREVLAQMTPEEVNEDRLQFADKLARAAQDDLDKLGLALDTLKIQSVSDDTGYLDSLGRPRIARALRDAENAENQAQQEITQAEAEAMRRAEVAKAEAETEILKARNQLAKIQAELEGEARAVEEEAIAAAKTARAEAERELQEVRQSLEQKRLRAEVIIPAEVSKQAEAIRAKGNAASTVENGIAAVEVLRQTSTAWQAMGAQAQEIWIIQHLEEIVKAIVDSVRSLDVGEVNIIDRGDGSGLASYAAAYPKTIAAVLTALRQTTGVDVPSLLTAELAATPPNGATTTARIPS